MADQFRIEADPTFKEFRRQLREVNNDLGKELQKANKRIATEVGKRARSKYERRYPGGRGRGARSIRGLATQTRAQVALGGKKTPYVVGQNFGSKRFPQFPPKRDPDHFLYETVGSMNDEIEDMYTDAVDDLTRQAFPEGSPS